MKRFDRIMICFLVVVLAKSVFAETTTFDFKDPKNVNAVSIVVDSELEPNVGFATPTAGTVTIDTQAPKIISGKLSIPTSGITMTNSMMTKVLHSEKWLDAKKHPEVVFEYLQTLSMGSMSDKAQHFTVQGNMTIAGVTQKISAPVTLTLLPGREKDRNRSGDGDLLVLRSKIDISRKAFNINPGTPEYLVGDTISLVINLTGVEKP